MKILVTGSAGFIGNHVALRLLERGDHVYGIDNLNDYYSVALKKARLERISKHPNFEEGCFDLENKDRVANAFQDFRPDRVVHLAAQAGVRYSLENPFAYIDSNVSGTMTILEGCRHHKVDHFVFASTSSVYGTNTKMPFSEHHGVDHPISLYAATKRANELMAHTYAHAFQIPSTGLRFFTVYGPWGRPDMALFLFTKAISEGKPIDVFNEGRMRRSFTYIDDIVEGILRVLDQPPSSTPVTDPGDPDPATSGTAPFQIFNIGNQSSVELLHYIDLIEENLGKKAIKNMLPMPACDVPATEADMSELGAAVGYEPTTPVDVGIRAFIDWYKDFYTKS